MLTCEIIIILMTGIYKITNPKGKIYIGQSQDIDKRFYDYKLKRCKKQPKLYRSLNKYGVENHTFEIITECNIDELNKLERYYQELYDCIGKNGLNCVLQDDGVKRKVMSQESKDKLSKTTKGLYVGLDSKHSKVIIAKNLDTLEEHRNTIRWFQGFLNCGKDILSSRVKNKTKYYNFLREWIFRYEDEDFSDYTSDIYLDLHTGIYHFYDDYMDIPKKRWKADSIRNRIRYSKRYIKT